MEVLSAQKKDGTMYVILGGTRNSVTSHGSVKGISVEIVWAKSKLPFEIFARTARGNNPDWLAVVAEINFLLVIKSLKSLMSFVITDMVETLRVVFQKQNRASTNTSIKRPPLWITRCSLLSDFAGCEHISSKESNKLLLWYPQCR